MSLTFTSATGGSLPSVSLSDLVAVPFRLNNTGAAAQSVKIFVTGNGGTPAADVTNENGKEIALEGWLSIRPTTGGAWTVLTEPTTFPDAFADLSDGCYATTIAAGSYAELEISLDVPATFDTTGLAHFSLMALGVDA